MPVFAKKKKADSCIGTVSCHLLQHCPWLLLCCVAEQGNVSETVWLQSQKYCYLGFTEKHLPTIDYDKVNLLSHWVLSQLITLSVLFYSVLKDKTSVWECWAPIYFSLHLGTSWRSSAEWVSPSPCLILNFDWWSASDGGRSSKLARCCSSLLVISRDFKILLGNFFFFFRRNIKSLICHIFWDGFVNREDNINCLKYKYDISLPFVARFELA